jgi:hypothetical protein
MHIQYYGTVLLTVADNLSFAPKEAGGPERRWWRRGGNEKGWRSETHMRRGEAKAPKEKG